MQNGFEQKKGLKFHSLPVFHDSSSNITYHRAKSERPSDPNRPEWEAVAWPLVVAAVAAAPSCLTAAAVAGAARAWIQHWEAAVAVAAEDCNGLAAAAALQEAAAAA